MKILKKLKDDKGAVPIVEAAIVFPIVFFVVILFIVFGNFLYQQSKIDAIAVRGAEHLARVYSHPIIASGSVTDSTAGMDIQPYRYLSPGNQAITQTQSFINKNLENVGTGFFTGMEVEVTGSPQCSIKNYVVYHVAEVRISYKIDLFPMKLFDGISVYRTTVATSTAAVDAAEFIRNIDMIIDYADELELDEKLENVKEFFK